MRTSPRQWEVTAGVGCWIMGTTGWIPDFLSNFTSPKFLKLPFLPQNNPKLSQPCHHSAATRSVRSHKRALGLYFFSIQRNPSYFLDHTPFPSAQVGLWEYLVNPKALTRQLGFLFTPANWLFIASAEHKERQGVGKAEITKNTDKPKPQHFQCLQELNGR